MTSRDIFARCVRCYGYVLNLVAKAFLFGEDADPFDIQAVAEDKEEELRF